MNNLNVAKLLCSILFIVSYSLLSNANAQTSSYAGEYNGKWTFLYVTYSSDQYMEATDVAHTAKGTFSSVSITSDGKVSFKENGKISIIGKINSNLFFQGSFTTSSGTLKGTFKKNGNSLKATLKNVGTDSWLEIILSPKFSFKSRGRTKIKSPTPNDKKPFSYKDMLKDFDRNQCPNFYEGKRFSEDYNFAKAIEKYALEINKNNSFCVIKSYLYRGVAKTNSTKYKEAVKDFTEIIRRYNSQEARNKNSTGVRLGDINKISVGKNEVANAYFYRALAKEKLGERDNSCRDFQDSCRLGNKEACSKVKPICKN